jgi:hypothetical protein
MYMPANPIANDDANHLKAFESAYNMEALATWAHIVDYFGAAIARWKPQGDFQGAAITVGAAALEWHQNDATNPYQSNIEKVFKNALDELKSNSTGIEQIVEDNATVVGIRYFNLQGVEMREPIKGSVYVEQKTYLSGKSVAKVKMEK